SRFNGLFEQAQPKLFSIYSCLVRIYQNTTEPMIREENRGGLDMHFHSCYILKKRLIKPIVFASCFHTCFQNPHLATTDSRRNIAQPIIIADLRVLVMRSLITGLSGQKYAVFLLFFSWATQG